MNMLASAGINPNDSDIEFEPEDECRYKKNKPRSGPSPKASAEDAESMNALVARRKRHQLSSEQPTVCCFQSVSINGRHCMKHVASQKSCYQLMSMEEK